MAEGTNEKTLNISGSQMAGAGGWLSVVALAAYFSPELALFALTATVIGMGVLIESERRSKKNLDFKKSIATLRNDVAQTIRDVARIDAELEELKAAQAIKQPMKVKAEVAEPLNTLRAERYKPANVESSRDSSELSDVVIRELVQHAVGSERIDVFLQPIMRLPQRKMRFFEMYARVRAKAGLYIPAQRYMRLADKDVITNIDNLLLLRCLRILKNTAHLKRAAPFFLNIETASLRNARFMESLLTFVAKNRELAARLVFEMKQDDFDSLSMQVLQILTGLSKLGCNFSIDHVTHLDVDAALMMKYHVRFIKIEAAWLLAQAEHGEARIAEINKLKRKLEANGIGVIVEKIENEKMMRELLDFDINYGQGYLFGKPELEGAYRQHKTA